MILNPFVGTSAVGSGGVSYFFEERFEGTGYQNSWTESGTGTVDEDYTTSPLEGAQSLRIAGTNQSPLTTVTFASDQAELWWFCRFRVNVAMSATRPVFNIRNSSGTAVGGFSLIITTNVLNALNGTNGAGTTDALVTGTDYNVWGHWLKGTGANGVASIAFSTSGTEPLSGNAFRSIANGTATTDAHDLRVGFGTNATGDIVIDKILFSTTGTIGDSPA